MEIVILLSAENDAVAAVVRPYVNDVVHADKAIVEKSKPTEGNTISIRLFARSGVARVIEILYVPRAEVVIVDVISNYDTEMTPLVGVIIQLLSV